MTVPKPGARARVRRFLAVMGDRQSLAHRATSSASWRMGGHGVNMALRLGSNLVLTRLLAPEAFGLMAMVFTIQTGLMMLTDIGANQAVIRSPNGGNPDFLRTAWTVKLLKNTLVAVLLTMLAATLALVSGTVDFGDTVYADPALPLLIAAASLTLVIRGAESASLQAAERRLETRLVIGSEIAAQIIGVIATVLLAYWTRSVWALAIGGMIGASARCAMTHLAMPGPRMRFMLAAPFVREIWGFGKWLIASSIFAFLSRQGDKLLLGALLEPTMFGVYAVARIWVDAAFIAMRKVSQPVTLAAFSEIRLKRPDALRKVFIRVRLIQGAVCVTGFAVFALVINPMIQTLYAPEFRGAGPIALALSPLILTQLFLPFGALLLSAGDSRTFALSTFISCTALFMTFPIVYTQFGLQWSYLTIAIAPLWGELRQILLASRIVPLKIWVEYAFVVLIVAVAIYITQFT